MNSKHFRNHRNPVCKYVEQFMRANLYWNGRVFRKSGFYWKGADWLHFHCVKISLGWEHDSFSSWHHKFFFKKFCISQHHSAGWVLCMPCVWLIVRHGVIIQASLLSRLPIHENGNCIEDRDSVDNAGLPYVYAPTTKVCWNHELHRSMARGSNGGRYTDLIHTFESI